MRPHQALGMRTPAAVYAPSPRSYPARVPELEYPDAMLVRAIKSHGHFRWKKHDVFLSEVLWGERIGLLPVDDGCFTVYFAHLPLAGSTAEAEKLFPLPRGTGVDNARSGPGQAALALKRKNQNLPEKEKVSDMCPV